MHCSDLERYLEACLDGQLGDSRRQALKDHLALCGTCRERVDSLRRFEADLQRRLRSMQHEVSLYQPLGLETAVAPAPAPRPVPLTLGRLPAASSGAGPNAPSTGPGAAPGAGKGAADRPSARPGHRLRLAKAGGGAAASPAVARRLQNLAGLVLVAAAVGAIVDLTLAGLGWLARDGRAAVYRAYVDGGVSLDLRTAETGRLSVWLGEQLGVPVSLPTTPGGFALIGGSLAPDGLPDKTALAVYATAGGPALLMIEAMGDGAALPADQAASASAVQLEDGLARLDWQEGGHSYSLIGALPPEKLALFAN